VFSVYPGVFDKVTRQKLSSSISLRLNVLLLFRKNKFTLNMATSGVGWPNWEYEKTTDMQTTMPAVNKPIKGIYEKCCLLNIE
jgi:hypothetical protein